MIEANSKGRQARKYFIECEKKLKENRASLPTDYKDALLMLIEKEEEKERMALEHKHTKMYISDKQTATALQNSGAKTKVINRLQIELDDSKLYATIKRVELVTGTKYNWRTLKTYANDNNLKIKKVFDNNYGTINSYDKETWSECYDIELDDLI
jgi:hypothetical protein